MEERHRNESAEAVIGQVLHHPRLVRLFLDPTDERSRITLADPNGRETEVRGSIMLVFYKAKLQLDGWAAQDQRRAHGSRLSRIIRGTRKQRFNG